MKTYCVALDGDGHFCLSEISNRTETIKLLKKIQDGDYWANTLDEALENSEILNEEELLTSDDNKWLNFVKSFEQRATMEIKTMMTIASNILV